MDGMGAPKPEGTEQHGGDEPWLYDVRPGAPQPRSKVRLGSSM
jgi:hypothetical protein